MNPYRSQWIPIVYCVLYSTQYTVQYTVHHTLYCTLYSIVNCVVHSVQCSMQYTVQYMVYYTVYGIMYSMGLGLSADNSKASCGTYFVRPSWDANPFIHYSIYVMVTVGSHWHAPRKPVARPESSRASLCQCYDCNESVTRLYGAHTFRATAPI